MCVCVQLQIIQCVDVAEQALQALNMLSRQHGKALLHAVSYHTHVMTLVCMYTMLTSDVLCDELLMYLLWVISSFCHALHDCT